VNGVSAGEYPDRATGYQGNNDHDQKGQLFKKNQRQEEQEKQAETVGQEMKNVAVQKRPEQYPGQTFRLAGLDTERPDVHGPKLAQNNPQEKDYPEAGYGCQGCLDVSAEHRHVLNRT